MSPSFRLLVDALCRYGARVLCMIDGYEGYCDDSGKGDYFTVAGFLFEPDRAKEFTHRAVEDFDGKVFHSKGVFARKGQFKDCTKQDSNRLFRTMVERCINLPFFCVAFSCLKSDISSLARRHKLPDGFRTVYPICLQGVMGLTAEYLRYVGKELPVAYFFEKGSPNEGEAAIYLERHKDLRAKFLYASHSFVPKVDAPPLWSADWLAWEWTKQLEEGGDPTQGAAIKRRSLRAVFDARTLDKAVAHAGLGTLDELIGSIPAAMRSTIDEFAALGLSARGKISLSLQPPRLRRTTDGGA